MGATPNTIGFHMFCFNERRATDMLILLSGLSSRSEFTSQIAISLGHTRLPACHRTQTGPHIFGRVEKRWLHSSFVWVRGNRENGKVGKISGSPYPIPV